MALCDFYDHSCNIYHLAKEEDSPGYGLKAGAKHKYPDKPNEEGIRCHFGVKTDGTAIIQGDPPQILDGKTKLTLAVGVDIRLNDKVVDCDTGLVYIAEIPKNIRGHHLSVKLNREDGIKGAL